MLIWFAVTSVLVVAIVFKSPGVDYRFVIAGSVLPLAEAVLGGPRVLHSVIGAVALLVIVVAATRRRRLLRRRILGLPIGMMCHLVFDGSFTRAAVFWWPLVHRSGSPGRIPELGHLGSSLVLEIVGVGLAAWAWGWFGLTDPSRRDRFLSEGRLDVPGD